MARIMHLRRPMTDHCPYALAALFVSCTTIAQVPVPYDLERPMVVHKLPPELVEVSALTDVDSVTVACLQDELGKVYHVDLRTGQASLKTSFAESGDFEGLTRVGIDMLALRSDGLIYRLRPVGDVLQMSDTFRLRVAHQNLEGLGYDDLAKRVLVSPKDLLKGGPEERDVRVLYAFDPDDPEHRVDEVLTISLVRITHQARAKGIAIPTRRTEKGREVSAFKLRYSSVAVHPFTGHYYLLSAVDRSLLILDRTGGLIWLAWLNERILPKPEGITFLPGGDMLISNEGKGGQPDLLRFNGQ